MRRRIVEVVMFVAASVIPSMSPISAQAAKRADHAAPRIVLVELFTSEGCSSCPPADDLLRKINGQHLDSGQLVIGISEHVTYWNQLGWSDPYSAREYTDRQSVYGDRFHLDSVYTPQMVIDGAEQIVGNDSSGLQRAIQKEHQPLPLTVHIASADLLGHTVAATFSISGEVPAGGADVFAIVTDDTARSSVLRGENSGHTLLHVSVARGMQRVIGVKAAEDQVLLMTLPASVDASKNQSRHLILFIQAKGQGRVLGVDTKPL